MLSSHCRRSAGYLWCGNFFPSISEWGNNGNSFVSSLSRESGEDLWSWNALRWAEGARRRFAIALMKLRFRNAGFGSSWLHSPLPLKLSCVCDDLSPSPMFLCAECFVAATRTGFGSFYIQRRRAGSRCSPVCDRCATRCWCCCTNPSDISCEHDRSKRGMEQINQLFIDNCETAEKVSHRKSSFQRIHYDRKLPRNGRARKSVCWACPDQLL